MLLSPQIEIENIFEELKEKYPIKNKVKDLFPYYNFEEEKKDKIGNSSFDRFNKKKFSGNTITTSKSKYLKKMEKNIYNNLFTKNNNIEYMTNIDDKSTKEKEIIETSEEIYYKDYEINSIPYEKALEIDKRSYCQLYCSLIKNYHIVFFTFNCNKDHNPRAIKICFFFFVFALYMFINTLFFNDAFMHKIYLNKGQFSFILALPQIIYSVIICRIIIIILKNLSLTQNNVLEILFENNISILNIKFIKVIECIKKKIIFFFVFSFIFLLFFWYYLSCFCFIYYNTQIYLFKVILISYSISIVNPFIFSLFPGLFRIPALKSSGKCIYIITKLFNYL
jgi:hypothetical protein